MKVEEVYQFYDDNFKPLYSETEARDNALPVEVLFEIHSAFDHLKRFYVTDEGEADCCRKAHGHLVRGCLDMYKLKLKDFNSSIESFQNKIDPEVIRLIDNGAFYPALCKDKLKIIQLGKEARQTESNENKDAAFAKWAETAAKIDLFEETYINSEKISWAKTCHRKKRFSRATIAIVWSVCVFLAGVILEDPIKIIWASNFPGVLPPSLVIASPPPASVSPSVVNPPPTVTSSRP